MFVRRNVREPDKQKILLFFFLLLLTTVAAANQKPRRRSQVKSLYFISCHCARHFPDTFQRGDGLYLSASFIALSLFTSPMRLPPRA